MGWSRGFEKPRDSCGVRCTAWVFADLDDPSKGLKVNGTVMLNVMIRIEGLPRRPGMRTYGIT